MRKLMVIVLIILLGVVIPVGYLELLHKFLSYPQPAFRRVWEDNVFSTRYQNPVWVDSRFGSGWNMGWALGQTAGSYGFVGRQDGVGDLFATFGGFNPSDERGVSGIMVEKSVQDVNTLFYPYLVIRHRESSANSSVMFSFGVVDEAGRYYRGEGYHAVTSWEIFEYDLRKLYNGTVSGVAVFFTNDFYPFYDGGLQHSYIDEIGIYQEKPSWSLSQEGSISAVLSGDQGSLRVSGGNPVAGTVISGQRFFELPNDLEGGQYLRVLIKTSGIDVAARIMVWTSASDAHMILLKTYNDNEWHEEIIDLSYFDIDVSKIVLLELGWQQVYDSDSMSVIWYSQLSFNKLEWS